MAKVKAGIVIRAFDKVTAPLKKINASLESIRAPVRRLNNSFAALSAAAGLPQLRRAFGNVASAAGRVGREVMALGRQFLIFGGLAAAGIWKAITSTSEAADRLAKLSKATGMSVESIQTLGFAFEQSGGTADQFQLAVGEFATKLGQAKNGAGRMASMLKKIDPALLSTMKKATDTGDAFRAVFAGIARAKTDSERMALATAAFGQAAAIPIVNLAKEGEEGLAKLEDEMLALGIITDEDTKKAELFDDAWKKTMLGFSALKAKALLPLMPVLKDIADAITNWFIDQKDDVEKWGKDFAEKLPERLELLKEHLRTLRDFLSPIGRAFKWIGETSTRLKVALGVLAALVGGKLLISIGLLSKALLGLFGVTLTTPIGWVLLAFAAMAGAAYLIIKNWDAVRETFVKLWDSPLGKLIRYTSGFGWLVEAAKLVVENWEPVKELFSDIWNTLKEMWGWLSETWFGRANAAGLRELKNLFNWGTGNAFADTGGSSKGGAPATTPAPGAAVPGDLNLEGAVSRAVLKQGPSKVAMVVDFKNVPQGVRVTAGADKNVDVTTKVSYLGIQGAPA